MMAPLEPLVGEMWPNLRVIPAMALGASDARYTSAAGMPTYILSGLAQDRDDDRYHARDERVAVETFYKANEFWYRYLTALTAQ